MDNLDNFQKLVSTPRTISISTSIGLDLDWSRLSRPPTLLTTRLLFHYFYRLFPFFPLHFVFLFTTYVSSLSPLHMFCFYFTNQHVIFNKMFFCLMLFFQFFSLMNYCCHHFKPKTSNQIECIFSFKEKHRRHNRYRKWENIKKV